MRSAVFFKRIALLLEPFVTVFTNIIFALRIRVISAFALRMDPLTVMSSELLNLFCVNYS